MNKYILLAAVAISLVACNTEDNYIDEPIAAQISATIGDDPLSRASDTKWDNGDCIGISMSERYVNMRYITEDGDGSFDGTTLYFKNKREPVTISAYYPYTGSEGQTPDVIRASTDTDRQNATEQPKFDFLYASMDGVTGADPNVNLTFSHMMSKLTLTFKNGAGDTDNVNKITSYTLEGLLLDGTFNPVTSECAADSNPKSLTITLTGAPEDKPLTSLILFPQDVEKLILKINDSEDQDYVCELKLKDNRLESGKNYLFTITVNKTGLSVNPSIAEWKPESSNGNAMSDDSEE